MNYITKMFQLQRLYEYNVKEGHKCQAD